MKRIALFFLALGLVMSLSGLCLAAEEAVSVSDSKGGAGQTVYLAVTVNESVMANTVGVACEFDDTLLTALPELCTWEKTGLLSAFEAGNIGVWAGASTVDLKGKLCVLAFQIKEGVAFSQTQVTCTVILKDDATEVGTYTVQGTVTCDCTHDYGDWTSAGQLGHTRVCSLCGGKNTQSHAWNEGEEWYGTDGVKHIVRTCNVCREQSTIEVPAGSEDTQTAQPDGVTVYPTVPGQDAGGTGSTGQEGHDHSHSSQEEHDHSHSGQTGDAVIPDHTHAAGEEILDHTHTGSQTEETAHDHDHTAAGGEDPVTLWVILGVLAAAVAAGVLFVKKKS